MDKYNDIAIFGAGDFGQEVSFLLSSITELSRKRFIGYYDDNIPKGAECKNGIVLGNLENLKCVKSTLGLIIAVGNPNTLFSIKNKITGDNFVFPNVISPSTYLLESRIFKIGIGNIFLGGSFISYDVEIGNFNIFNTGVNLGHHAKVGDFNILSPNVQVSGKSFIGDLNFFGLNSAILPMKGVGDRNRISAGSIVSKKFGNASFLSGNPALTLNI
jgi:acetyltransferase-like isoleucine patch superfamily enzyme